MIRIDRDSDGKSFKVHYSGEKEQVLEEFVRLSCRMVDIMKNMYECSDECAKGIVIDALHFSERRIKNGTELD